MFDADLKTLKHWVENDMSMIQNLGSGDRLMFNIIAPFLEQMDINADKVMFFLKTNRPDIHNIITREWISKQIDELKGKV